MSSGAAARAGSEAHGLVCGCCVGGVHRVKVARLGLPRAKQAVANKVTLRQKWLCV